MNSVIEAIMVECEMYLHPGRLVNLDVLATILRENLAQHINVSRHGVVVDQNYFWNLDMVKCPPGKVQLLGAGGLPAYGYKAHAPTFYKAWAPIPKMPT